MRHTPAAHHPTNFGLDVATLDELEPPEHYVVPAHVDEHIREEILEGHHPDHATNFGLILPVDAAS